MVAVLTEEKLTEQFGSAQDLAENNLDDGNWKGQFREKFAERSEQIEKIKAGLNEEVAINNIHASKQEPEYIIDPITGEVVKVQGSEGELSVSAVIGLLERGASDEEIEVALNEALTTIAGKISKDKKKAKKYLAEMMELMHVIETVLKQSGKNIELQNTLRQMQERVSKLMKDGNVMKIQEFLKSNQLREVLTKSLQQSRQQVDLIRLTQELTRNLAHQAKEANLPRELALKELQKQSSNVIQSQLKASLKALKEAYDELLKEYTKEKDPTRKEALKESIKEIAKQAKEIQQLQKQVEGKEVTSQQFEQVQKTLKSQLERTNQLTQNPKLSDVARQSLNKLAIKQQTVVKAVDARLAAQRVAEGNFKIANQAARQENLANLKAQQTVLSRVQDRLQQTQRQLTQEKEPAKREALQQQVKDLKQQLKQITEQTRNPNIVARQAEQKLKAETSPNLVQQRLEQVQKQLTQVKNPADRKALEVQVKDIKQQLQQSKERVTEQKQSVEQKQPQNKEIRTEQKNDTKTNSQENKSEQTKVDANADKQSEARSETNKAELKQESQQAIQEMKAEQPNIKESQAIKRETNQEVKVEGEKANIEALNAQKMQQQKGEQKVEEKDPCNGCGGGKGCCAPVAKVDAKQFQVQKEKRNEALENYKEKAKEGLSEQDKQDLEKADKTVDKFLEKVKPDTIKESKLGGAPGIAPPIKIAPPTAQPNPTPKPEGVEAQPAAEQDFARGAA